MYNKSQNSSIFQKQNRADVSYTNNDEPGFGGESVMKFGYQITDLQRKMDNFGGMDQVEEDIINELTRTSQRLDALTSKVRLFLKLQPNPRDRKSSSFVSYSPSPINPSQKQGPKHTTSQFQKPQQKGMRLKDRVQKALQEQDSRNQNIQKQPKYIK